MFFTAFKTNIIRRLITRQNQPPSYEDRQVPRKDKAEDPSFILAGAVGFGVQGSMFQVEDGEITVPEA